jgi:hypothetical protein
MSRARARAAVGTITAAQQAQLGPGEHWLDRETGYCGVAIACTTSDGLVTTCSIANMARHEAVLWFVVGFAANSVCANAADATISGAWKGAGGPSSVVVTGAGNASLNGEYGPTTLKDGQHAWQQVGGPWQIYTYPGSGVDAQWYIAQDGVVWAYTTSCALAAAPPAWGWKPNTAASFVAPAPNLTGDVSVGCSEPPPPPKPPSYGKNCSCTACVADWGRAGCPDLHTIPPDLVRPPMVNATPAAGQRVRATHSSYAHTQAYHALYLPTDWVPGRKYPVVVEYMGNGPWHDGVGDVSTGRPEDSNLG